jgi:hypothetical protein
MQRQLRVDTVGVQAPRGKPTVLVFPSARGARH